MSVPSAIFIDISILDEQNYNFQSSAIGAFVTVVKGKSYVLLLPDPTQREINRHIQERADAVLKALEEAKRRAPFLAKWKDWPVKKNIFKLNLELKGLAEKEWSEFKSNFKVASLGYDGVILREIMDWYDRGRAPFGSGKKRKEFPDAFALAALISYAKKEKASLAVVSRDDDFKKACSLYTNLLYYPSLPAITEALISGDKRIETVKALLEKDTGFLNNIIREEFTSLSFYPEADPSGDVEDVDVDEVSFNDLHVVGIGNDQCTVAFEAQVNYSAYVTYDDPDSAVVDSSEDFYMPLAVRKGNVFDWCEISGIAKLNLKSDWSAIEDVELLVIDDTDVAVTVEPDNIEYK